MCKKKLGKAIDSFFLEINFSRNYARHKCYQTSSKNCMWQGILLLLDGNL
jgi:hypothetical protein